MKKTEITGTITGRDKILNEQLEGYIFDEERVLRSVPFGQFVTRNDEFAVGLLLPKDREDRKSGKIVQEMQPVVLTSARTFHPIFDGENRALGIIFESVPGHLPRRYSLVIVPQFLKKIRLAKSAREIFEQIKLAYEESLYFTPAWYTVHAIWDMATYFFGLFPAFPYLELRGVKAAGKSKVMTLSSCFTFNASPILSSPTEASLFRTVHDQRPTLYLDEAENLFRIVKGKVEHDGRVEVINSGYNAEGRVPRVEKIGTKFVTVYFSTYCPKMLASINGLHGATESRAIVHTMTRAPDNDHRGEREIDRQEPRWQEIRDELLLFSLESWRSVREAYEAVGKEKPAGLKKRDLQLWRPLLAVARLIGGDVQETLLSVARQQQAITKGEEYGEDSWEFCLLLRMKQLLKGGQQMILFKELRDAIPGEEKPGAKTIRGILDRLGFRDLWQHTKNGNGYFFPSFSTFEAIALQLTPSLFSSSASLPSQNQEIEGSGFSEVNIGEENREMVKHPGERGEGNEGNERVWRHEDALEWLRSRPDLVPLSDFLARYDDDTLQRLRERGEVSEPRAGYLEATR